MGNGTLTIYSASAGSGKTFQLAGIYLSHLFRSGYHYRKILAVTFTNKATAEMKGRILDQLHRLSIGGSSEYLNDLLKQTGKTEKEIRTGAREILNSILHDYTRFSVCTIDAFFQKILRAFARESGLQSGFNIELDHSQILSLAVDDVIASSIEDKELGKWLNEYVSSNLEEEKPWNLKDGILKLSEELFREKFKIRSEGEIPHLEDKNFLLGYIKKLTSLKYSVEREMASLGKKCLDIFDLYSLTDEMFYYKSSGIPGYIKLISRGKMTEPNSYVRKIFEDPPKWATGKTDPQLQEAIENGLDESIRDAIRYFRDNATDYKTAIAILKLVYALGILSDVLRNVRKETSSENSFLISDAGEFIRLITRGDQSPFIYEKIGNTFENYLIDEFQDTSTMQWENFYPLIDNSMAEGFDNLLVGDVKQSIYRWRNSDWQILGRMQDEQIDDKRIIRKPLLVNWRSRSDIIRFNNSLFSVITEQSDTLFQDENQSVKFSRLYSGVIQDDPGKESGGYVRLEFISDEKEDQPESRGKKSRRISKKWKDIVLERLPAVIEAFQDKGYRASDIGILVRDKRDGAVVLQTMIEYAGSCLPEKRNKYNYSIVSDDSLTLSNSAVIIFIISALKVINNPDDMISRAQMLRFFLFATEHEDPENVPLVPEDLERSASDQFPAGTEEFLGRAGQMSLFEAIENIISFFSLGKYSWNVSYLNTFQDMVISFTGSKNADTETFIEWWESKGSSGSVVLPENQDAAKVFTIHKAKGLEFPVVILPFLSWHTDHESSKQPVLWVIPGKEPFSELGIVPVKYHKDLCETIFANDYLTEKYSAYIDNINLLYVAMTRAVDAMYGFIPGTPGSHNGIAVTIKEALTSDANPAGDSGIALSKYLHSGNGTFEFGKIPEKKYVEVSSRDMISGDYKVNPKPESLRLKLHGENYFLAGREEAEKKINYGKLMHEVFEGINSASEVRDVVSRMVLEGKIQGAEAEILISKLNHLISSPPASDWFNVGNLVLKEAEILLPSGVIRRPDRVMMKDGKTIIVDFKFGDENRHHFEQVKEYSDLLAEMGYQEIEAFLWYVDSNKIVKI
jgi:ATP-dependent helicase/nuclease subunit A